MKSIRHYWVLLAIIGIVLGGVAWAALAPLSPEAREEVFVIPKGTWARRMAGQDVENFPAEIYLTLEIKDILVLKNHDDVPQMFGPVLMMPGQSFRLPFSEASRNDFACSAHVSGQLTVFVAPKPNWWRRTQLRAVALAKSRGWI